MGRSCRTSRRRERGHDTERHQPEPARWPALAVDAIRSTTPGCRYQTTDGGLGCVQSAGLGHADLGTFAEALNLDKEDSKLRDRYGRGSNKKQADGSHKLLDDFLLARRLVEAGARCVTLAFSRWDWHGGNFTRGRQDMPMLDQGLTSSSWKICINAVSIVTSTWWSGRIRSHAGDQQQAGRDHLASRQLRGPRLWRHDARSG